MYNIELPKTVNRIIAVFYGLGLWDTQEHQTGYWSTALKMFHFAYYISCVTSIAVKALLTNDTDDSVFLTALAILATVHVFRMLYIILKKNETTKLIHKIGTHTTNDTDEFVRVDNKIKKFMKFGNGFLLACICEVSMVIIFPILSHEKPIINVAFPFNGRIVFWIKQMFVLFGALYSVVCVCLSVIIWYLLLNCAIKYELLGVELRNLGDCKIMHPSNDCTTVQKLSNLKRQDLENFLGDLIEAVKSHREINE